MKKIMMMIIFLAAANAYGSLVYDDNQEHTLDFVYESGSIIGFVAVGGSTTVNVIDGADFALILAYDSVAYITGGKIRTLSTNGTSNAYITGGELNIGGDFYFRDNSVVNVKGGLLGTSMNLEQNASLIFYGTDFTYSVGSDGPARQKYLISGTLESGDILDDFKVYAWGEDASVQFVPEPATVGLLALGGMLIRRRRSA